MRNGPIRTYRDLDAWNMGMDLTVSCYVLARKLPVEERFELSGQLRSAAVSVPANVAEGHASGSDARFEYHVRIALGSTGEVDTHLEVAVRTKLLTEEHVRPVLDQIDRTRQVLHGLARSIQRRRLRKAGTATVLIVCLLWLGHLV